MSVEIITKEDLEQFRKDLLSDIEQIFKNTPVPMQAEAPEEWLKSAEVKARLKISFSSLQNLRISGKVNPKKILGVYYYNRKEIDALFK
ncbi:helix-turn-helix domain-containing protein [Pedobacter nutrimenti]|uniref:helix-turn-helix domain-containing protein n=1 Tax=Pedobacter nutrimenti TaxID=1241337 RepID=UPI00292E8A0B|nr:helix-turn-helix domain-containing protein [Pedobacter nutrimenti]